MPRYFFNIYDGVHIFDETGTELVSKQEIPLHMIATALELVGDEKAYRGEWEMEVLDERGRIVNTMTFGLEAERDRSG